MKKKIIKTAVTLLITTSSIATPVFAYTPTYKPISQQSWYKELHSDKMNDALEQGGKDAVENNPELQNAIDKAVKDALKNIQFNF